MVTSRRAWDLWEKIGTKTNSNCNSQDFPGGPVIKGLPRWISSKESTCKAGDAGDASWILGREDPWRRKWIPTPIFLRGKSHGQRILVGYSPQDCKEWHMTEQLTHRVLTKRPQNRSRTQEEALCIFKKYQFPLSPAPSINIQKSLKNLEMYSRCSISSGSTLLNSRMGDLWIWRTCCTTLSYIRNLSNNGFGDPPWIPRDSYSQYIHNGIQYIHSLLRM